MPSERGGGALAFTLRAPLLFLHPGHVPHSPHPTYGIDPYAWHAKAGVSIGISAVRKKKPIDQITTTLRKAPLNLIRGPVDCMLWATGNPPRMGGMKSTALQPLCRAILPVVAWHV